MGIVMFLLLLVVAAIAAGAWTLIVGWNSRGFVGAFVGFGIALIGPAILPGLLGG